MSENLLLKIWPKHFRMCNIGDCPAFYLTNQDWENIARGSEIVRKRGMEAAVKETGVPVGTCKVDGAEVFVNSSCNVSNRAFVDYYSKLTKDS